MVKAFGRGYKQVKEEKARQEEEKSKRQNQLWRFFLIGDGDEADISFLTEEPINFQEHTIKAYVNGKERYNSITCAGEDCVECEMGDRPSFKGAYLIIDHREFEYTKDGKKQKGKDQVRLFVQGTKVLSQLDRLSERYGITDRTYTIVRLGKGTSTSYTFERGEPKKLNKKEIEQFLPENLRKKYDGTMESLYNIVEEQVMMGMHDNDDLPKEDDLDDEDVLDKLVSVDDMMTISESEKLPEKDAQHSKLKLKKKLGNKF